MIKYSESMNLFKLLDFFENSFWDFYSSEQKRCFNPARYRQESKRTSSDILQSKLNALPSETRAFFAAWEKLGSAIMAFRGAQVDELSARINEMEVAQEEFGIMIQNIRRDILDQMAAPFPLAPVVYEV